MRAADRFIRSRTAGWILLACTAFNYFMAGVYAGQARLGLSVLYVVIALSGAWGVWIRLSDYGSAR